MSLVLSAIKHDVMHAEYQWFWEFTPDWLVIERFSFEGRKVFGFASTTLQLCYTIGLKNSRRFFIQSEVKLKLIVTRSVTFSRAFPSATCNNLEFWLAHCIVYILCDWPEWLLWFWYHDTQLKSALTGSMFSVTFEKIIWLLNDNQTIN